MKVTTAMVKELREATGAGVLDAKKALVSTDGDFDKSVCPDTVLQVTAYTTGK